VSVSRHNDRAARIAWKALGLADHLGIAAHREVNPKVVLLPIGLTTSSSRRPIVDATNKHAWQICDARDDIEPAGVAGTHVKEEILAGHEGLRRVEALAGKNLVARQELRRAGALRCSFVTFDVSHAELPIKKS
jgi:hypothetical protein